LPIFIKPPPIFSEPSLFIYWHPFCPALPVPRQPRFPHRSQLRVLLPLILLLSGGRPRFFNTGRSLQPHSSPKLLSIETPPTIMGRDVWIIACGCGKRIIYPGNICFLGGTCIRGKHCCNFMIGPSPLSSIGLFVSFPSHLGTILSFSANNVSFFR
jgi:hypothetical protein